MATESERLADTLRNHFGNRLDRVRVERGEVIADVPPTELLGVCQVLRDTQDFGFRMLMDLAGIDYLAYGVGEWETEEATADGFSRGVEQASSGWFTYHDTSAAPERKGHRFAVAYQLLSIVRNQRLRLKVMCADDEFPVLDSVTPIWASADWYEREAFDLYGIVFEGHPDLRRILTDYGFVGHPFRKDFPLVGNVQMRYDETQARVVYEPATIEPRVLVPRTIRDDHRYAGDGDGGPEGGHA